MLIVQLQFTASTWLWLAGCLLLGTAYAWLVYGRKSTLSPALLKFLFAFRALSAGIIAFLLFAPLIRKVERTKEKPLIIVAQDNSSSILISRAPGFDDKKYLAELKRIVKDLSADYELRFLRFGTAAGEDGRIDFTDPGTDISSVFRYIENKFVNRNIGALVLGSDGIYNKGGDPVYLSRDLRAPVYTVALGDTVPKRDVLLSDVSFNNIVYLNNQFQIEAEIEAFQARGANPVLTISGSAGVLFSKNMPINSNEFRSRIPIILNADRKGVQAFTIRISGISNELSEENNVQRIFVEVIDGRKKVLILADSPHPDLGAIRRSVENNRNYSVDIRYAVDVTRSEIADASLVILHQLPSLTNTAADILKNVQNKPLWFILGNKSNLPAFNNVQSLLNVRDSEGSQEVGADVRSDFYSFNLEAANRDRISNFAPLLAPFGTYTLKSGGSVLLAQRVGKVSTSSPLFLFGADPGRKLAVLAGEGIWRWSLEDFRENNDHQAIDELLSKTVRYLSSDDDQRKFRVYPARNAFDENERVRLNAELYNDALELINEPDVNIVIRDEKGRNYSYVFSRNGNSYSMDAGILPAGDYTYSANTQLGAARHRAEGRFAVSRQMLEFRQTVADHQLLFAMADGNGGRMLPYDQLRQLPELIRNNELIATVSYEDSRYEEMLSWKILFFLILTLLSVEWFLRKREGEL